MKLTPDMIDAMSPAARKLALAAIRESHQAEHGKPRAKRGTGKTSLRKKARALAMHGMSPLEADMLVGIRIAQLPEPERQYAWHPDRKFRADFAWPAARLLVECEGGVFDRRAHGSVSGILHDIERGNEAVICGWRVLRFSRKDVDSGGAIVTLRRALDGSNQENDLREKREGKG